MNVNAEPFIPGGSSRGSQSPGEHHSPLRVAVAGQGAQSPPQRRTSTGGGSTIPFAKRPDCMFYVKGTCTKGPNCLFRHNRLAKTGSQETCRTWEQTLQCDDPNCTYLHPKMQNTVAGTAPVAVPFPPIPWSRRPDCMYFLRGVCNKGDRCVYRHSESTRNGPREVCPMWTASGGTCTDMGCIYVHPKKELMNSATGSHPSTPSNSFFSVSSGSSPYSPERTTPSPVASSFMPRSSVPSLPVVMFGSSSPVSTQLPHGSVTLGQQPRAATTGPRQGEPSFQQKRVQSFATLPTTSMETLFSEVEASSPTLTSGYLRNPASMSAQVLPLPHVGGSPISAARKMSFDTDSQQPVDMWERLPQQQQLLNGPAVPLHMSAQASPMATNLPSILSSSNQDSGTQAQPPTVRRNSLCFGFQSQSGPGSFDGTNVWMMPSLNNPSRKEISIDPEGTLQTTPVMMEESSEGAGSDDEEDGHSNGNGAMLKGFSLSRLLPSSIKEEIQSSERSDEISVRDDLGSNCSAQSDQSAKPLDLSLDSPPFSANGAGLGSDDKTALTTTAGFSTTLSRPGGLLHMKKDSISGTGSASGSAGSNRPDCQSEMAKLKDYRVPHRSMDSGIGSDTSSYLSGSGSDFTADTNNAPLSPLLMPPLPSGMEQMSFDEFTVIPTASEIGGGLVKTVKATRKTAAGSTSGSPSKKQQPTVSLWVLPANIINPVMDGLSGASSSLSIHVYSQLSRLCDFSIHTVHRNILPYIGFCSSPHDPFCIVSECVPPVTLYSRVQNLAKEGLTMSFAERVHICSSVATALKTMHSHGIVHGSLSPSCIHLLPDRPDEHGHSLVQVSGYGILSVLSSYQSSSRKSHRHHASAADHSPQFTALQFMDRKFLSFSAPEVLLPSLASVAAASMEPESDAATEASTAMSIGSIATEKSDIYSFGVMMLFMLLDGVIPFEHQTSEQFISTVENRVKSHSKTILSLAPTLQCEFGYAKLLDKCLRVDPSKRPPNMDAILGILNSFF